MYRNRASIDPNILQVGDRVFLDGDFMIGGQSAKTRKPSYPWPEDEARGTVQAINFATSGPSALVIWDLQRVALTVDVACLRFLDGKENPSRFKIGDEVRMITPYHFTGSLYERNYPGVGSTAIIIDAYADCDDTFGRYTGVSFTEIRSFIDQTGTLHKVYDTNDESPHFFHDYSIDEWCLQLVVPSSREIKRALESIERTANGEPPPMEVPQELLNYFREVRNESAEVQGG